MIEVPRTDVGGPGGDPFTHGPPRYVRAGLYLYHFTRFGEGKDWWRRERVGPYMPPLGKDDPRWPRILSLDNE